MDRVEFVAEFGRLYWDIAAYDRAYHIAEPGSEDRKHARNEMSGLVDETLTWLLDLYPLDQEYEATLNYEHVQQCFAMAKHDIFMQALLVIDALLIPVLVMRHFIGEMALNISIANVKSFVVFCNRYRDVIFLDSRDRIRV